MPVTALNVAITLTGTFKNAILFLTFKNISSLNTEINVFLFCNILNIKTKNGLRLKIIIFTINSTVMYYATTNPIKCNNQVMVYICLLSNLHSFRASINMTSVVSKKLKLIKCFIELVKRSLFSWPLIRHAQLCQTHELSYQPLIPD